MPVTRCQHQRRNRATNDNNGQPQALVLTKPVSGQNKPSLIALANHFQLEHEANNSVTVLQQLINKHLDNNYQTLYTNPEYQPLYGQQQNCLDNNISCQASPAPTENTWHGVYNQHSNNTAVPSGPALRAPSISTTNGDSIIQG
ncbi:hypothetical protein FA15DRAFT_711821 [Coprinopsis marcescibilis]|uniref:Uncharacterized protein n=1 Tax=Coprinopsis marcescibilis TaxID=230819 RepID=A0A5C3K8R8_COPMA|nr:hypothetical protein FA15DRAFT_711821 [Coprinopsis marcescibilis]